MIDTPEYVTRQFEAMMQQKSPEERLRMGCSMFDAAKQIVLTAVRDNDPHLGPAEIKKQVFLRFYGEDFSDAEKAKILMYIKGHET